jgi:CheY-like chemotaxis protein
VPDQTVLVIDDDPGVRESLCSALAKAGYRVQSAANGEAGILALERGLQPDLIVLDLMMPVMSGFEVIAVLREEPDWAAIPVVVVSATPGQTAQVLGVDAILKKPFNLADVRASILVAIASRRPGDQSGKGISSSADALAEPSSATWTPR